MTTSKPLALVVFLENVGHIVGLNLPQWAMNLIDFVTEEYAKLILRLYGAYRRYDRVVILEDEDANGRALADTLLEVSHTHRIDTLLLVHGLPGCLIGYKAKEQVGDEIFGPLCTAYEADPTLLDLRMVYGVNCHGITLASMWTTLGAKAVNGAVGVNWMPEPSLTTFLRGWLRGKPYSYCVQQSNLAANRFWSRIWKSDSDGNPHINITSSRQVVFGAHDITIHS